MNDQVHEEIIDAMRERFHTLKRQREAALTTADNLYEEMKRIRSAWQVLVGKMEVGADLPETREGLAQAAAETAQQGKPARASEGPGHLKLDEVRSLLQEILVEGPLTVAELRERIGAVATERKLSRKGLHFTIGHALKRGEFEQDGERWKLRKSVSAGLALAARVRRVLKDQGALTQPQLRDRIAEETNADPLQRQELEHRLGEVLRQESFEFNGAKWHLVN